jgi:hypothetical protein
VTLVEILVALAVALMLLAYVWVLVTGDYRRFNIDESRIAALEGGLLFDELLSRDLERLVLYLPDARHPDFNLQVPVRIADGGHRLELLIAGTRADARGRVVPERVRYSLDRVRGRIVRQQAEAALDVGLLAVQALAFELVPLQVRAEAVGLTPSPRLFRATQPVHFLKYQITALSEALLSAASPIDPAAGSVSLVGVKTVWYRSRRLQHPYWMFNINELLSEP